MQDKPLTKCPLCKSTTSAGHAPFCSKACKDKDLLQWLGDGYKMAGPPADHEDSASPGDYSD